MCRSALHDVDDREPDIEVEAGGGKECRAGVTGEERVAAPAAPPGGPLRLGERVHSEAAGAYEPALGAGACERFEKCVPVARRAMAEAVALLVAVGACPPDQLGACDEEVLVDVIPGAGKDARSAGAPLETDSAVSGADKRTAGCSGPVGKA